MRLHQRNLAWMLPRLAPQLTAAFSQAGPRIMALAYGTTGSALPVRVLADYRVQILDPIDQNVEGHPNHLVIVLPSHTIRMPFIYFLPDEVSVEGCYSLYRLSLHNDLPDAIGKQLVAGYHGITRRPPLVRFYEHFDAAKSGDGFLLHGTWHSLRERQVPHQAFFSVIAMRDSLKGIYKLEEFVVDEFTLAPKGLNAIPGGEAGIKMLHEMALLKGKRLPSVQDRDAAIQRMLANRNSPTAHLRSRHLREYAAGKFTWVKECLVNGDGAAHA